jgi:hypothetical protein
MILEKQEPNKKRIVVFVLTGLIISILIAFLFISITKKKNEPEVIAIECNHVLHANAPITATRKLSDKNDIHLLHAQKNGINPPFATNEELELQIDSLLKNNILVELQSNDLYKIKRLRHSHPYLTPNTAQMINEIATRFNEKIKEYKVGDYRIMLTSLLRTEETQNKLSKRNVNAASLSAHYFATTIDISYKDFYNVEKDSVEGKWEAIQALSKVLSDMREECKLLALRERKQACFHITSVACDPIHNKPIYNTQNR